VGALLGNKVVPGLLDRYLGRFGYEAQQTNEPADTDRHNNLAAPLPGDRGAHGIFDGEAHAGSVQFLALAHRRLLATSAAAAGLVLLVRRGRR
jgi:hypothetical protein